MTIIAYDGVVLAADRMYTFHGIKVATTKIFRYGDHMYGSSGPDFSCNELNTWAGNGRITGAFPKCQDTEDYGNLLYIENGKILLYTKSPIPTVIEQDFFAIGAGKEFALAFMHEGISAVSAIENTCLYETSCGLGIDVIGKEDDLYQFKDTYPRGKFNPRNNGFTIQIKQETDWE